MGTGETVIDAGASAAGCVNDCEEEVGPTPLQQSSLAAIEKVFVVPPSLKND